MFIERQSIPVGPKSGGPSPAGCLVIFHKRIYQGLGKIALLTGASRGIGRAIAIRLASDGAQVLVQYSNSKAEADKVVEEIRSTGGEDPARPIQADLSTLTGIDQLVAAIDSEGECPLDILVNHAGIQTADGIEAITESDFDRLQAVNVKAPFFLTRKLLRRIRRVAASLIGLPAYPRSPFRTRGLMPWAKQRSSRLPSHWRR